MRKYEYLAPELQGFYHTQVTESTFKYIINIHKQMIQSSTLVEE